MYNAYFNFTRRPFASVPQVDQYFPASTIEALIHLSVPRYILGNMLSMIIGQNLARKLCSSWVY